MSKDIPEARSLPRHGYSHDQLLGAMQKMAQSDADWRAGKTWALVYDAGEAHREFLKKAHNTFFTENALNPLAFKSLKRMEAESVRMIATMLNGDDKSVGTLTSGGTESILLACKTYRDRAKWRKPWVRRPEIVAPVTVHVAFEKAAHYFGMKLRTVPVDKDYRVDMRALKKAVNRNTVMIAASAPHYPQGVIDPIEEIAAFAKKKKLPFHVDACVGGFILPFIEKLGYALPLWDFRVDGVTSISADLHKYGYAAKGASSVIYRSMDYLKHQFFVSTDWPGGIYASATLPGTRPGGTIAAAWATLMTLGEDGYLDLTRRSMKVRDKLVEGVTDIDGLEVLGRPDAALVSYSTTAESGLDIFAVADQLEARGWQFDRHQNPNCIHCTCSAGNEAAIEGYLADLRDAVEYVRAHPEAAQSGNAAMYGMMAKVPVRGFVKLSVRKIMEGMYGPTGEVPDLSAIGQSEDDDLLFRLIAKYGEPAMAVFDRVEKARDALLARVPFVGKKR
ncbi:MAG: aspartate aminotransferase family protein [Myxococcales bacterium]|nr:aspartate aminotransferase family protein [Myxococcales bacterium]